MKICTRSDPSDPSEREQTSCVAESTCAAAELTLRCSLWLCVSLFQHSSALTLAGTHHTCHIAQFRLPSILLTAFAHPKAAEEALGASVTPLPWQQAVSDSRDGGKAYF